MRVRNQVGGLAVERDREADVLKGIAITTPILR